MLTGMESQKGASERMCGGGGARVEDIGELGLAAVRRRSGVEGQTFDESVPPVAEGDVGGATEAVMAGFLTEKVFGVYGLPVSGSWRRGKRGEFARGVRIWEGIGRATVMIVLVFSLSDLYLGE